MDAMPLAEAGRWRDVALDLGLIEPQVGRSKGQVRDWLRAQGREEDWIELQGLVYGARLEWRRRRAAGNPS